MKKSILTILLCVIMVLGMTGCGSKPPTANPFNSVSKFLKKIDCDEINDIVDINPYLSSFITKDGKVYVLSFNKPFSNNKNCKLIESETKMTKYYNYYMVGENDKLYYAPSSDTKKILEYERAENNDFKNHIYGGEVLDETYNAKTNRMDYKYIEHYLEVENQKKIIYKNKYNREKEVFVLKQNSNENVEYIIDRTIKTNQGIYIYDEKTINEDECENYADVSCIKERKFHSNKDFIYENGDSLLSDNFNKIKFYKVFQNEAHKNKTFVVTDDGLAYTNYYDY